MENRDRTRDQGGQGKKPGQGGGQQQGGRGEGQGVKKPGQGGREGQGGSDKPTTRPTPSGVPNEGRGTEVHHGNLDQGARTGPGDYEYKGGRQGTGGIPNPDDSDDRESASSFRGTAEQKPEVDGEDDDGQSVGARQRRNQNLNSQPRNPK